MQTREWMSPDAVGCRQEFMVSVMAGLHLRPAAMLAKTAIDFASEITVLVDEASANAKSVMSLILLNAKFGNQVVVTAEGRDAPQAIAAISDLFASQFGE